MEEEEEKLIKVEFPGNEFPEHLAGGTSGDTFGNPNNKVFIIKTFKHSCDKAFQEYKTHKKIYENFLKFKVMGIKIPAVVEFKMLLPGYTHKCYMKMERLHPIKSFDDSQNKLIHLTFNDTLLNPSEKDKIVYAERILRDVFMEEMETQERNQILELTDEERELLELEEAEELGEEDIEDIEMGEEEEEGELEVERILRGYFMSIEGFKSWFKTQLIFPVYGMKSLEQVLFLMGRLLCIATAISDFDGNDIEFLYTQGYRSFQPTVYEVTLIDFGKCNSIEQLNPISAALEIFLKITGDIFIPSTEKHTYYYSIFMKGFVKQGLDNFPKTNETNEIRKQMRILKIVLEIYRLFLVDVRVNYLKETIRKIIGDLWYGKVEPHIDLNKRLFHDKFFNEKIIDLVQQDFKRPYLLRHLLSKDVVELEGDHLKQFVNMKDASIGQSLSGISKLVWTFYYNSNPQLLYNSIKKTYNIQ